MTEARAEMLVADARQAIEDEAPLDQVQSLTSELQQVLYGLQPAPAGGGSGRRGRLVTAMALQSATTTWSTPSSTGAEPHGQFDEHPRTDEDRDGVGDSQPEPVNSQPDSDAELAKLEDRWRRAVADLDNLRKRYAHEDWTANR